MQCDYGSEYMACGPSYPKTCDNLCNAAPVLPMQCTEGCHCPNGTVLHDGKCVTPSQCPCFVNGVSHPPGSFIISSCQTWYVFLDLTLCLMLFILILLGFVWSQIAGLGMLSTPLEKLLSCRARAIKPGTGMGQCIRSNVGKLGVSHFYYNVITTSYSKHAIDVRQKSIFLNIKKKLKFLYILLLLTIFYYLAKNQSILVSFSSKNRHLYVVLAWAHIRQCHVTYCYHYGDFFVSHCS